MSPQELEANKEIIHLANMLEFVTDASEYLQTRFDDYTTEKADFLKLYFSGKFGEKGRQNLIKYKPEQIGHIFRNILDYYINWLEQQSIKISS